MSIPGSCPIDPAEFDVIATGSRRYQLLVSRGGSFPYRQGRRQGAFTGRSSASLRTSYNITEGSARCRGQLHWRLHPAKRRPVADGRWTVVFSDGERQHTTVNNGGRSTSLGIPQVAPDCGGVPGGSTHGGITIFIPANRKVNQTLNTGSGGHLQLLWMFTSKRAGSGRFTASAPGCTAGTLTFTARQG
jgi:hypothetical protein